MGKAAATRKAETYSSMAQCKRRIVRKVALDDKAQKHLDESNSPRGLVTWYLSRH
jgi:hypothetical protein